MLAKQGFKLVMALSGVDRTFDRRETPPVIETISAADSNFFRNTIGPEEITINANEIVVDIDNLTTYGKPEKGHRVTDTIHGTQTIDTVVPMMVLTVLVGYRIRFK